MPGTAILCGILLILIGVVGAFASSTGGSFSKTALIPAGFGVVLAILGALAKSMEGMRKHLMHVALLVALIGLIGVFFSPAFRGIIITGGIANWPSFLAQAGMAAVCLIFIVLGIKSFADARRAREA
jgi:hypothetical protein